MKRLFLFSTALVLCFACDRIGEVDKQKEHWITGIMTAEEWGVDTVSLHDCYCNMEGSKINIHYYDLRTFEGSRLLATIAEDSINIELDHLMVHFATFTFEKKEINLDQRKPQLGEQLTGKIKLVGQGVDHHNKTYKFDLKGNLKCILRDSTYGFDNFRSDLHRRYDSLYMLELRKRASTNPDSVTELYLEYENYYLIREHLKSFCNLSNLTMSGFPSVDMEMLSNLKLLKTLTIEGGSIKKIPENISDLRQLESLSLSGPINSVPESLYTMTNLKELDLGGTDISYLSPKIKNLTKLQKLNIGYSEIRTIPMEIFELNLSELALPDELTPFSIERLNFKSLKTLNVPYSLLVYNKKYIGKLKNLEWLYPTFKYPSHEEYMEKYADQIEWLEKQLPNVSISETIFTED